MLILAEKRKKPLYLGILFYSPVFLKQLLSRINIFQGPIVLFLSLFINNMFIVGVIAMIGESPGTVIHDKTIASLVIKSIA